MAAPKLVTLTCLLEPRACVLADRLQHPEALLAVAEQTLVDERLHGVQICFRDRLGGLQRGPAGEDRKPGEEPLLVLVQQVVTPLDRGAQCRLAWFGVSPSLE